MAKVMNGIRGNSSNEVKYPLNSVSRAMQPALSGAGSMSEAELDDLYEPKPDKKVVRVVTVIAYMFSVSLGAIVLSLYYLFLWNPYKGSSKGSPTTTSAIPSNLSSISNLQAVEPITSALQIESSTSSSTLLNSTAAVLISTASSLVGPLANGVKESFNNKVTPKTFMIKQKRSSDTVFNFEDKIKTSFSPTILTAKPKSTRKSLLKRKGLFDKSVLKGDYITYEKQNAISNNVRNAHKDTKKTFRAAGLRNVKTESPFDVYNIVNNEVYLEDPFTTYAKAQRAKGRQNNLPGIRHHPFHGKEGTKENVFTNQIIQSPVDAQSSSSSDSFLHSSETRSKRHYILIKPLA